jgi:hypothetical protein
MTPTYMAGRDGHRRRFEERLQAGRHVLLTGPRGTGKSVLLKEYVSIAEGQGWAVVRRNINDSFRDESMFRADLQDALKESAKQLSRLKSAQATTRAISEHLDVEVSVGISSTSAKVRRGRGSSQRSLTGGLTESLISIGKLAERSKRPGCLILYDNAELLRDVPAKDQYSLSALVAAFGKASHDEGLPVMLVLAGLPTLSKQVRRAASGHAERLFEPETADDLALTPGEDDLSQAALALVRPASGTSVQFDPQAAEEVATDVKGYPFFLQLAGETLWLAADREGVSIIDSDFYQGHKRSMNDRLTEKVYRGRWEEVRPADRECLAAGGASGAAGFRVEQIKLTLSKRSTGSIEQSLHRLTEMGLITPIRKGSYVYVIPGFGEFLRREHPLEHIDL